ncbi:hypothetical protein ACMZ7D_03810 [Gardnerella vaginalis]|uniref:hypothetical protein n=1 Tax=Gardnerella vaginalis TaxID=2702 RepID=UPI0039EE5B93
MRSKALLASNILASIYIPILFGTTILLIEQISKIRVNIPYMSFEFWILIFKLVQYSSTALTTVFVIVVLALLHVVLFVLAILLGWIAYARKSWGTGLASAIIYLVGSVIFPISLVLVLPIMSIVFGFIGAFDQRKYHKKEKLENNTVEVNLKSSDDHVICQVSQTKVILPSNNSDNFHKDGMNASANNNIDVNQNPTFAGQAPTLVGQNPNAYESQPMSVMTMPVTPAQVTSMSASPQNVINTTSVTDSTSSINPQNEGTNHKNNSFRDYYISLKQSTTKVFQNNVIITKCRTFFKKEYKAIEDTISNIDNNGGSAKNNAKNNAGNSVRNGARNNAMNNTMNGTMNGTMNSAINNTRNCARNVNNHVMNVNNGARNINNNATNVNSSGINANNVINVQSNANAHAPYRR